MFDENVSNSLKFVWSVLEIVYTGVWVCVYDRDRTSTRGAYYVFDGRKYFLENAFAKYLPNKFILRVTQSPCLSHMKYAHRE